MEATGYANAAILQAAPVNPIATSGIDVLHESQLIGTLNTRERAKATAAIAANPAAVAYATPNAPNGPPNLKIPMTMMAAPEVEAIGLSRGSPAVSTR